MKLSHAALFTIMLLLPLGLKLGFPAVLVQAEQAGLLQPFIKSQISSAYTVKVIALKPNLMLTVHTPEKSSITVRLLGLQAANEQWQSQQAGTIAMLLQASNVQVALLNIQPIKPREVAAIVALPNGTSLQEVLLEDGLAELEPSQLSQLPQDTTQRLQQAETEARKQRKNIWGENHTHFVNQP